MNLDRWVRWYCANGNGTDPRRPRITARVLAWLHGETDEEPEELP